jgi:hypothetical protein
VAVKVEQDTEWSNADEVLKFLYDHEKANFEVGEYFELPDIEQVYTVVAARPFRSGGSFYLFLDLEARCAVAECENAFVVSLDVNRWRQSRYVTRCCSEHRYKFQTAMPLAWKTLEERIELIHQRNTEAKRAEHRKAALAAHRKRNRRGVTQTAVLAALRDLTLLGTPPRDEDVVRLAVSKLPEPKGKRDTRRQQVVRALQRVRSLL